MINEVGRAMKKTNKIKSNLNYGISLAAAGWKNILVSASKEFKVPLQLGDLVIKGRGVLSSYALFGFNSSEGLPT